MISLDVFNDKVTKYKKPNSKEWFFKNVAINESALLGSHEEGEGASNYCTMFSVKFINFAHIRSNTIRLTSFKHS